MQTRARTIKTSRHRVGHHGPDRTGQDQTTRRVNSNCWFETHAFMERTDRHTLNNVARSPTGLPPRLGQLRFFCDQKIKHGSCLCSCWAVPSRPTRLQLWSTLPYLIRGILVYTMSTLRKNFHLELSWVNKTRNFKYKNYPKWQKVASSLPQFQHSVADPGF